MEAASPVRNEPTSGRAELLDREGLLRALRRLSERIAQRGVRARIHVAGGAALVLGHRRTRSTIDVDALSIDEREVVLSASREVAEDLGLDEAWLNDDVRDLFFRTSLVLERSGSGPAVFESPHLVVTTPTAAQLLAMKAQASRAADAEDIAILIRELQVADMDQLREIHDAAFPYDPLPPAKEARLEAILRRVLGAKRAHQDLPGWSIRPPPGAQLADARPEEV